MESHILHCIASKFSSRPKAYSKSNIQTYLKLQEASLNIINIIDYYLKSFYSDKNFVYNEKEVDFSILIIQLLTFQLYILLVLFLKC